MLLELFNTINQPVNPGEYDVQNGVHPKPCKGPSVPDGSGPNNTS